MLCSSFKKIVGAAVVALLVALCRRCWCCGSWPSCSCPGNLSGWFLLSGTSLAIGALFVGLFEFIGDSAQVVLFLVLRASPVVPLWVSAVLVCLRRGLHAGLVLDYRGCYVSLALLGLFLAGGITPARI